MTGEEQLSEVGVCMDLEVRQEVKCRIHKGLDPIQLSGHRLQTSHISLASWRSFLASCDFCCGASTISQIDRRRLHFAE
jgi:hypothetical protein